MAAPPSVTRSTVLMDTVVTLQGIASPDDFGVAAERAFGWFRAVEAACSRFDPSSEVMRLAAQAGAPVPVSALLFEAVNFALAIARDSGGAFDPTVGLALERRGFNRHYLSGQVVATPLEETERPSFRDVRLDGRRRTITLLRPLVLDLGAVVKGLAIDLAARELMLLEHFSVDAGGDLYVSGCNAAGEPWRIGIEYPRAEGALAAALRVTDMAVCTSGNYARPDPAGGGQHHILDPRTGRSPGEPASVTVVAPTAMLADAMGTAAFVLGAERGMRLLARRGVEGLFISADGDVRTTSGMARYLTCA